MNYATTFKTIQPTQAPKTLIVSCEIRQELPNHNHGSEYSKRDIVGKDSKE
jgi:hypothetical protein